MNKAYGVANWPACSASISPVLGAAANAPGDCATRELQLLRQWLDSGLPEKFATRASPYRNDRVQDNEPQAGLIMVLARLSLFILRLGIIRVNPETITSYPQS